MTLTQRTQWIEVVVLAAVVVGLVVWLAVALAHTAPADIDASPWIAWVAIAMNLALVAGRGWARSRTQPGDEFPDERDRELRMRADARTLPVFMALAFVPLVLGVFGAERFWVLASLFAAFAVAGLANGIIRLVLYSRG